MVGLPAAAAAAFVAAVDPYWLWRDQVSWRFNAALENRMRFVKSMQVIARDPSIVLLGSSVVYRGMDPADIASDSVYNLGISSLRIHEAEVYVRQLLRWRSPDLIVLGVDYFAFDQLQKSEPGFDPTLVDAEYLAKAGFTAFLSAGALTDAWRLARRDLPDTDGAWQRNGFKATRPRTSTEVKDLLGMTETFFASSRIERSELAALSRIIQSSRQAGVRLALFIPPYHRSWIDAAGRSNQPLSFDAWIAEVAKLARAQGVELWDFARANPYAEAPIGEGSAWYLDPSHFSPLLGRWILQRLGLPLERSTTPPPPGFGARLS